MKQECPKCEAKEQNLFFGPCLLEDKSGTVVNRGPMRVVQIMACTRCNCCWHDSFTLRRVDRKIVEQGAVSKQMKGSKKKKDRVRNR
jgi:hypothetical protein